MSDPITKDPNASTLDLLSTIKMKVAFLVLEEATGTDLLNCLLALTDQFMSRADVQREAGGPDQEDVTIATEMAVCATAFAVMVDAYFQKYAAAASDAATQTRH